MPLKFKGGNKNTGHKGRKFGPNSKRVQKTQQQLMKDTKGYWAYSFFQKIRKGGLTINEQQIKNRLYNSKFNPYDIEKMMNPKLSLEESILQKKISTGKINSKEKIILENYLLKQKQELSNDIESLSKHKLNADISTPEGRLRKLLLVAEFQLKKNNNELVYYVYQKICEFEINSELKVEFKDLLKQIRTVIERLDIIKLQFTKFHSNMPPLNNTGFNELEPFQKQVILNIDSKKSSIVSAPTSSGKSIMTGYLATKQCKTLIVVPTDILAWQMASMFGKYTKSDVPIITRTFESDLELDNLIRKINLSSALVGTPTELTNILPLISNIKFDWIVVDEIHMMGKPGFEDYENILKVYNDVPFLALSATIGNIDKLQSWFLKIGHTEVDIIECKKRFINQQRYYYKDGLNKIHPLSLVSIKYFDDSSILKRDINITPPDIWDLVIKLKKYFDLEELDPNIYFAKIERIELNQANKYFKDILNFMIKQTKNSNRDKIEIILKSYLSIDLKSSDTNLVDVAINLRDEGKTPSIFFQIEQYSCLDLVKEFSADIKEREVTKYPKLRRERMKLQSKVKQFDKKKEQMKIESMGEKKLKKEMLSGKLEVFESTPDISILEPHKDFIFNKHQHFNQYYIEKVNNELKKFFPMNGDEYHYIIDLLWRGVGVYVKGLPDPYLNIIQELACNGKLAIVFSDISLVFGVSMPFRTSTLICRSNIIDNIDSMLYHQMAGRAGRRGLDKEGNVVFVGYSWDRIKELSISKIPNIEGIDSLSYGSIFASQLSILNEKCDSQNSIWNKINKNFLLDKITNEYTEEFVQDIKDNLSSGAWNFCNTEDKHLLHLMWKLRSSEDCFRIAFLIKYIKSYFQSVSPNDEKNQIELANFICRFFHIKESENKLKESKYNDLVEKLDYLNLEVSQNVDSKIFKSIQNNKLETCDNCILYNNLREDLLKLGEFLRYIQHYFYYSKEIVVTRLFGKLLTRIWWIYHSSSPL